MSHHPSRDPSVADCAPRPSSFKTDPTRRYVCCFCQQPFKRSDTRRIHYSRCPSRISTGTTIPPAAPKGRKRHACDPCARRRRACDDETPCSRCKSRNIHCTRNQATASQAADVAKGLSTHPPVQEPGSLQDPGASTPDPFGYFGYLRSDDAGATWINNNAAYFGADRYLSPAPLTISRPLRPVISLPPPGPLAFLLNFTIVGGIAPCYNFAYYKSRHKSRGSSEQPCSRLLESSFESQTPLGSGSQLLSFEAESYPGFDSQINAGAMDPAINSPTKNGYTDYFTGIETSSVEHPIRDDEIYSYSGRPTQPDFTNSPQATNLVDLLADPLFPRTREIFLALQELTSHKEFLDSVLQSTDSLSSRCMQFFSPYNLRRFVDLYWDDWYPHCPITHRPSFDIQTVPLTLLLAMTLLGATISPSQKDKEGAMEWLDWAEEIAFREAYSQERESSSIDRNKEVAKPAALQAAFLTTCLQHWEGSNETKTRIRRQRYGSLVDYTRSLGFERATHNGGKSWATDCFDWSHFIAVEELIRTFTFIFLVDSSFVIFNNSPSKMLLQELNFDLVSPAQCFEAEDSQKCLFELKQRCPSGSLRANMSLITSVQILHHNTFDEETSAAFLQLDSLNLFSIISAIFLIISHEIVFIFGSHSLHNQIRNALNTWALLWNARSDLITIETLETMPTVEPWKRVGFFQHADEFRIFALGIIDLLQIQQWRGSKRITRPLPKVDESSMEQVVSLLRSLAV